MSPKTAKDPGSATSGVSGRSGERLARYRAKRGAGATPEPFSGGDRPRLFVVQKHAATRMHYDFRLEWGGALLSWAVPKGPCLDASVKRLAVHVEDHPVDYADFEGVIPEDNYGAGPVIVWDYGQWLPLDDPEAGLRDGKLLFELRGYKLGGVWTLVRTARSTKEWLLIKKPDGWARPEGERPLPEVSVFSGRTVEQLRDGVDMGAPVRAALQEAGAVARRLRVVDVQPMLAEVAEAPFSNPEWVYELKYDGFRLLVAKDGERVVLLYRSGHDATALYPDIVRAVQRLPYASFILDAEVCVVQSDGRPSFQRLQQRAQLKTAADVRAGARDLPATLFAFDLLAFEGFDLRRLPLVGRKAVLQRLLPPLGPVRYVEHIAERGEEFFAEARRLGLEGMMAKKALSPYRAGRAASWLKVRADRTDDFVIVGLVESAGRGGGIGALCLAVYDGERFVYCGRVGTGFSAGTLAAIERRLAPHVCATAPCAGNIPDDKAPRWCAPLLVCEVRYKEWTDDGSLRLPVFVRLREDKLPQECRGGVQRVPTPAAPSPETGAREVPYTNLDKVFWPEQGYTKGRLIEFYREVSPWLLAYLRDRPVVLTRYPDGIAGKSFFQKDAPKWTPEWLRKERMWSQHAEREIDYFVCDDVESLLYLINMGTIPLHVWSSRVLTLQQPDWCALDLDPKGAPFDDVVRVALAIRRLCEEIELPSFVKTSGSTGLHILLPLGRRLTFDQSRSLGELLAKVIVEELPDIATTARQVRSRGGRVYIDYIQNGHGRLLVSPLCVRPLPEAPVSMPLRWSQVTRKLRIDMFTLDSVPRQLARLGDDPVRPVLDLQPNLLAALARLQEKLERGQPR